MTLFDVVASIPLLDTPLSTVHLFDLLHTCNVFTITRSEDDHEHFKTAYVMLQRSPTAPIILTTMSS